MLFCLAIGSTVTVLAFGVVNTLIAGDLPGVRDRGRIVHVLLQPAGDPRLRSVSGPAFRVLDGPDLPGLTSLGGEVESRGFPTVIDGRAVWASGKYVSGAFFDVLGTHPVAGRLFVRSDDRPDAQRVAVLAHHFWRRHFGGREDAIGSPIRIGAYVHTVVGVAPAGFTGARIGDLGERTDDGADLWVPMSQRVGAADAAVLDTPGALGTLVVARLADGIDIAQAEAGLRAMAGTVAAAHGLSGPAAIRLRPFVLVEPGNPAERLAVISAVWAIPLLVLGIASVNVAGVHLARAVGRTHELGIRSALGASRARIVRLLVVETGIVASAASLLAWGISTQVLRFSGRVLPFESASDWRVLLFSLMLPVGVTTAAGLLPALRASGFDVIAALRAGPRVGRSATPLMRRVVLVTQIALCVALFTTTVFIVRGLGAVADAVGPMQTDVIVADVSLSALELDEQGHRSIQDAVASRVSRLPGVSLFGIGEPLLDPRNGVAARRVSSEWFRVLGMRFVHGRPFGDGDTGVAVVNESFARRFGGPAAAIGEALDLVVVGNGSRAAERSVIVGVVENGYERALPYTELPVAYVPMRGNEDGYFTLYARTPDARSLRPAIERALAEVDPRLAPRSIGTVAEAIGGYFARFRVAAQALGALSALTIVLVAVGLFGAIAHTTERRVHEFGVRLALGARHADVAGAVAVEALAIATTGAVLGFLLAAGPAAALSHGVMKSVEVLDFVPAALAIATTGAISLAASIGPVRRVFSLDPVNALRSE